MLDLLHLQGRNRLTKSRLSLISFAASSVFDPHSNSRNKIEVLSLDVDVISFKLLTVLSELSRGSVTLVSISAAEAPG